MEEEEFEGETLHWMLLHDKVSHMSKEKQNALPLVLIIAGSEGMDNTLKQLILSTYDLGYRVIAINPSDLYDQSRLDRVVDHLKARYPRSELLGVGV